MKYLIVALWGLMLTITSAAAQNGYLIKPGDTLSIEVLEDTQLNRSALVLPDGSFNFPFVGNVRAAGRTAAQVQSVISSGIAGNFASAPNVFVSVRSLKPEDLTEEDEDAIDIYFMGEVGKPGLTPVAPGTTFLQAMSQAGGFSKFAATKRVQLRRTNGRRRQGLYIINYHALSRGAYLNQDVILQDGDVILVPERRLFE